MNGKQSEPVCLLSVGTSVPKNVFTKEDFIQFQTTAAQVAISKLDRNDPVQLERIQNIEKNCGWVVRCAQNAEIAKRYTVVPNMLEHWSDYDWQPPYQVTQKLWRENCVPLAMEAVRVAIRRWGGNKDKITHVIGHSTTGWDIPGIANQVIYKLGLPSTCRAVPMGLIGCYGGSHILWLASSIAKADPNAVVLVVTCELSLIHAGRGYNEGLDLSRQHYLPNALFGDGAAAAIVGRPDLNVVPSFPAFELGYMGSHHVKNTRYVLNAGLSEKEGRYIEGALGKDLPRHINAALTQNFHIWMSKTVGKVHAEDCEFAIHPGGRKLLDNLAILLEKGYRVKNGKAKMRYCYNALKKVGNLESATIFFVMEELFLNTNKDHVYIMAMGPGVTLEYAGAKRYKKPFNKPPPQKQPTKSSSSTWLSYVSSFIA